MKKVGYKEIEIFLREENFQDPASASGHGTSYAQNPLCPTDLLKSIVFAKMWFNCVFDNWHVSLEDLNRCVDKHNITAANKIKLVSTSEFLSVHSVIIADVVYSMNGSRLWDNDGWDDNNEWETIVQHHGFDKYMKLYRFENFRQLVPRIFEKEELKTVTIDGIKGTIDGFNQIRKV